MTHRFDERLIELELAQYGLAAIHQLADDWKPWIIRHRTRGRASVARRVRANRSVAPSFRQRAMAAVLAAGPTAFASHETAAQLWELPLPAAALLEVTTRLEHRPRVLGVRMHRSGLLSDSDTTTHVNIPVATPALAIYSLSSRCAVRQLGRMVDDGVRRRILTLDDLGDVVERLRPAPGRSRNKMRIVLDRRLPGVEDRESQLEDFVLAAIVRFGLPLPVAQHPVLFNGQARRIDLCYPDDWLALEAKGFRWYKSRSVFDRDALRGNELQLAGYRVLSFTSAFTDWDIAGHVAEALRLTVPARPTRALTFAEWGRAR